MIRRFLDRRLVEPLLALLRQGLTPEKLSLSVALGVSLGIFPMLGSTTILCALAAWTLRLNQPAIQLINYFTYSLQLILFVPFFQAGAWLFQSDPVDISVPAVFAMLSADPVATIGLFWVANVRAMVAWLLVSPFLAVATYAVLVPVFRRVVSAWRGDG